MEKFELPHVPPVSETNEPRVEKLTSDQEQFRSNKLQLAWAMSRLSGENMEEKMIQAMEWINTEEGMAVSYWFRREVMDSIDPTGRPTRKDRFLSRVSDSETMDVPPLLLKELEELYENSLH